jgi:hypothetical protein
MRAIWVAIILLLTPSALHSQASERKVALVVANGAYEAAGTLVNPRNDAELVAASARRAGFSVLLARDLSLTAFQRSLRDFRAQADGAAVAMVYYAGHGIEGAGKNWLIPVDAQLKNDLDLPYEAIDLERVMEAISGAQVRMVVLDACRNNPFGRSWRSARRAVQRGLAGMEVDDVLVIYAAAPGQTAGDGDGANSPFATSLARRLVEPDLPVQLLGGAVRDDVLQATGGSQRPFVSASITGTPIYLVPRSTAASSLAARSTANPATASVDEATLDALGWQGALGAQSIAAFEEYKTQFPKGRFVGLADQNINRMRSVVPNPAAAAAPAPGASLTAPTTRTRIGPVPPESGVGSRLAPPALIFPDSSTRLLATADLASLETVQLSLARNEIFARHGFIFNKVVYQAYFGRFEWYRPITRDVTLNAIERANVQLLQQAERARGGSQPKD